MVTARWHLRGGRSKIVVPIYRSKLPYSFLERWRVQDPQYRFLEWLQHTAYRHPGWTLAAIPDIPGVTRWQSRQARQRSTAEYVVTHQHETVSRSSRALCTRRQSTVFSTLSLARWIKTCFRHNQRTALESRVVVTFFHCNTCR